MFFPQHASRVFYAKSSNGCLQRDSSLPPVPSLASRICDSRVVPHRTYRLRIRSFLRFTISLSMYLGFLAVLSEACWEDKRGEGRKTLIQAPRVRVDYQRPCENQFTQSNVLLQPVVWEALGCRWLALFYFGPRSGLGSVVQQNGLLLKLVGNTL